MKKLIFPLICLIIGFISLESFAQGDYAIPESTPANNGELDWLTYKDNIGVAKIDKKSIILKSEIKTLSGIATNIVQPAMTYATVPLNYNGDFYLSVSLKPSEVDNKHLFGLTFGVVNESNYCALLFDDQFCYLVRVYNIMNSTFIQGMEKRVKYKYQKAKDGLWTISFERKNGNDLVFSLNGLEVLSYSNPDVFSFAITDLERLKDAPVFAPCVGACVTNKGEVKISKVAYEQWMNPNN